MVWLVWLVVDADVRAPYGQVERGTAALERSGGYDAPPAAPHARVDPEKNHGQVHHHVVTID